MPAPDREWADTELVVAEVIASLTPGREPVLVTGDDLQDVMPLQLVRRVGGTDDGMTDVARIDVETYAAKRAEAYDLAEAARQLLLAGPARTAYGLMDRARTEVGPRRVVHPDQRVRMYRATYRVSVRRRRNVPLDP